MMKNIPPIIFSLFFILSPLFSQELAVGEWEYYLPYKDATTIARTPNSVLVGTSDSYLFTYYPDDWSLEIHDKQDGFSNIKPFKIEYIAEKDLSIIAYENSDIDLLDDNLLQNIPDLKNKLIPGDKKIYDIYYKDPYVYMSTGFGILLLDLEKKEFKDQYYIGEEGASIKVNATRINESYIMSATEVGLRYSLNQESDLADFNFWNTFSEVDGLPTGEALDIELIDDVFWAAIGNEYGDTSRLYKFINGSWSFVYEAEEHWRIQDVKRFSETELVMTEVLWEIDEVKGFPVKKTGRIRVIDQDGNIQQEITDSRLRRPLDMEVDENNGTIWIADDWYGLLRFRDGIFKQSIAGDGPYSQHAYDIALMDDQLWVASGKVNAAWQYQFWAGGAYVYDQSGWDRYDANEFGETVYDIILALPSPDKKSMWMGSYGWGLVEYDGEEFTRYKEGFLGSAEGDNSTYRVGGMDFDRNGNLWISNYGSSQPLRLKTKDGEWKSFDPDIPIPGNTYTELLVDSYGQKWIALFKDGILVYDSGQDILSATDDTYKLLGNGVNNGNLHSKKINALAEDAEGEIWVGTDDGITIFYCPYNVLQSGCDADRPVVGPSDNLGYLLASQFVTDIKVDAANRKWVGTALGVYLLSEDGRETIHHFTEENSPLLDNYVTTIEIDGSNGYVYFGTAKGVCVYRSTAIDGPVLGNQVKVFPNPVRPEFEGDISISGLPTNSIVKVTDVSGQIVYETEALGGQAIWDGKTYQGDKVKAGVYLVYSASADGLQKEVSKILLLR